MGVQGGPKTNTTGLVLNIDAANVKSFRGEPTTNLLPNLSSWGGYVVTPTIVTVTDGPPYTLGKPKQVLQMVTSGALAGGGNYGGANSPNIDLLVSQSQSVAVSFWARSLSGNNMQINFSHQNGSGDNSNLAFTITNLGSEWRYLQNTASLNLTKSQFYFWNQNIRGGTFQITDFQLENKAYPTPYVSGTRGSGSAQGGGWVDLTYGNNSGVLTNGPTFNSASGGSIVFDGLDDYISMTLNGVRVYDSTIMFVIKLPTYAGGQRCILSYRGGSGGSLYIGKQNQGIFCYYDELLPSPGFTVGSITNDSICFVAVVLDATNTTMSTYINGILAGSVTRTGWVSNNNTRLNLGYDAGGTNEYMLGNMYMFSHYNRVLSAQEILENFNAVRSRFGI